MDGILDVPEYIPPYGWRYKGARISEEEAESICRDMAIPFCIERGEVETTFLIRTAIAGTQFVEGFEELTSGMEVGEALALRRMPRNRYDSASVSVLRNNSHIGYVPRVDNKVIASLMDSGHRVVAVVAEMDGGRIVVDLLMMSEGRRLYRHFTRLFEVGLTWPVIYMENRPFDVRSSGWKEIFVDFEDDSLCFEYRQSFG